VQTAGGMFLDYESERPGARFLPRLGLGRAFKILFSDILSALISPFARELNLLFSLVNRPL